MTEYYTGSLTPNSGSGGGSVDPNEIPAGKVYEGKFSELPQFFESLENKFCKGSITYKITEDEVLTERMTVYVPKFNIGEVIIEGNEKSIMGAIDIKSLNNTEENIIFNNITQIVIFQNFNIQGDFNGLFRNLANINLKIKQSSFNTTNSNTVGIYAGFAEISDCEVTTTKSPKPNQGIVASKTGKVLLLNNLIKGFNAGILCSSGGDAQCVNNTFNNCQYAIKGYYGGRGTIYGGSSNTSVIGSDTSFNYGIQSHLG